MSMSRRFVDLEENLEFLYEKLSVLERSLIMASDAEHKFSIKQRIKKEVRPQIREAESEYWQLLSQEAISCNLDDENAHDAVVGVIQIVESAKQNNSNQYPEQIIQLLTDIRKKLEEPGKSYSAKLKAAIPLIPSFVSYEAELETTDIVPRLVSTFSPIFKNLSKKK